jgi:leader peptidase (prepilin peptidase)/N-methyltransferase
LCLVPIFLSSYLPIFKRKKGVAVATPVPDWIWFSFVFALGCCIGSFLNVVIYRLPREKSLIYPGSACPGCAQAIRCYDNIPLLSWLMLGGKCRFCKAPVSPRYFVVELLTGVTFLVFFILYFHSGVRADMVPFLQGGWLVFLVHLILLSAFIAASAIDLELWIIPLSLCWFVTGAGLVASTVGGYVLEPMWIRQAGLLPHASPLTGALAAGGGLGLLVSWTLLALGVLRRSYDNLPESPENQTVEEALAAEADLNHRREILPEFAFLAPIVLGALGVYFVTHRTGLEMTWARWLGNAGCAGFLGSLWGYLLGAGVVWATRLLGTLAFGKEAMGLGDVHLMGAAGAVLGPVMVTVAFFVAPFFGLAWALVQMCFKKIRQIPYGPFLSMGTVVVMIFHDWILLRVQQLFYPM